MSLKSNSFIDQYKKGISNIPEAFLRLFFSDTETCYICGGEGDVVCEKCARDIKRHEGDLCHVCGRLLEIGDICAQCSAHERPYDKGIIAIVYDDLARDIMKSYKFENKLPYARFFAKELEEKVKPYEEDIDIVTSVPIHFFKAVSKGYNPPAVIAKKMAKALNLEYSGMLLKRVRYTKSMSLLKNIDRMEHSKKNFAVCDEDIQGKTILIVDDVSTTGATLHVCADILKKHGAKKVYVAAACGGMAQN